LKLAKPAEQHSDVLTIWILDRNYDSII